MTTIEKTPQELYNDAKRALEAFEGKGGKSLEQLREKVLNGEVLNTEQQQLWQMLEAEKKQLEKQVGEWGAKFREMIQPGNDFVIRRWGHGVV